MENQIKIRLQPKQVEVFDLLRFSTADYIGVGGGRGCAKSFLIDAVMLMLAIEVTGFLGCIVMRNYDQIRKFHIEEMIRNFPQLADQLHKSDKHIRIKNSQIDFSYAESGTNRFGETEVERRFRSGNYHVIALDQAEQFMENEIREMKNAARVGLAKMLLSFNMGGAGIQALRKWFHDEEYGPNDSGDNYEFVHVFPWDNVTWSENALAADGLTYKDYYSWSDDRRMEYCATRSSWGKTLNSLDDPLRNRDWLGSWDSLEGAYFGRVFDRTSTLLTSRQIAQLLNPWDRLWMSTDWGKKHFCATYWHGKTVVSPEKAKAVLGWDVDKPFDAVITFREKIVSEMSSPELGRALVTATPADERKRITNYFLSPDAFGERDSDHTTADQIAEQLRAAGMPEAERADTDRVGGAGLMYDLLSETKRHAANADTCWFIGAECPELLNAIPLAMSDPKNLDDILKTDKGGARIEQDALEGCFVANTQICTEFGLMTIGQLVDDFAKTGRCARVFTRNGVRTVSNAWHSGTHEVVKATFSDGTVVQCTPNHRFWTQRGFSPLNSLRYGDKLVSWNQSHSKDGHILSSTDIGGVPAAGLLCTEMYGLRSMGRSLRSTISTIKTATVEIIQSTILSASPLAVTSLITERTLSGAPNTSSIWPESGHSQTHGTKHENVASGPSEITTFLLRWLNPKIFNAKCAEWNSNQKSCIPDSVPTSANPNGDEIRAWTTLRNRVSSAMRNLPTVVTGGLRRADESAVRLLGFHTAGYADVYDLEVEGEPEFYANGLLVHNCRYGIKSMIKPRTTAPKEVRAKELWDRTPGDVNSKAMAMRVFMANENARRRISKRVSLF